MQVVPPLPLNVVKALQISLKFRLITFPFLSLLHETILYFFIFLFADYNHHTYKSCVIWFDSCCFAPKKVRGRCPCVASGKCVCHPSTLGVKYYSLITHIKLSFANVVIVLLYSLRTSTKSTISHILALVWCASYCFLIFLP